MEYRSGLTAERTTALQPEDWHFPKGSSAPAYSRRGHRWNHNWREIFSFVSMEHRRRAVACSELCGLPDHPCHARGRIAFAVSRVAGGLQLGCDITQ